MHPVRARLADLALLLAPRFASLVQTGLVRISLGLENDLAEIHTLVGVLDEIARRPRAEVDRQIAAMHGGTLLPQTDIQPQMSNYTWMAAQRVYSVIAALGQPIRKRTGLCTCRPTVEESPAADQ